MADANLWKKSPIERGVPFFGPHSATLTVCRTIKLCNMAQASREELRLNFYHGRARVQPEAAAKSSANLFSLSCDLIAQRQLGEVDAGYIDSRKSRARRLHKFSKVPQFSSSSAVYYSN